MFQEEDKLKSSDGRPYRDNHSIMWPNLKDLKHLIPELVTEICLRAVLLIFVCVIQVLAKPYVRHVSKEQLFKYYKNPRRESLVPPWIMMCIVLIFPLAAFSLPILTRNHSSFCQAFLAWTLALSINALITETVKLTTGRLRPDFFYRCFPDGKVTKGLQCTGDRVDVIEGRKSFPSGHSSFSFCSMGFVSVWMCGQLGVLSRRRDKAAKAAVCLLPLAIAAVVGVSRIYDNHHHWEDVSVGSFLGLLVSYQCYSRYFYPLDSNISAHPLAPIDIWVDQPISESVSKHSKSSSSSALSAPSMSQLC